jgi:DNA-binding beta-propeller fold protein YncE
MIYTQTNDAAANAVVAYSPELEQLGMFPTGGRGSGEPHLPSQGSVVAAAGWLFVANAGSGEVSVFELDQLRVVATVSSGGSRPVSVAVAAERAFVLNGGAEPSIGEIAFADWRLLSVRPLAPGSDPAQVALTPDQRMLVVTERGTNAISLHPLDGGASVSFASAGATPYGFDFAGETLVVTEAFGGAVGAAAASSYRFAGGALETVSASVGDTRSEVCWAVASADGDKVWVTNFGDGTVSRFTVGADGSLSLDDAVAAHTVLGEKGIRDAARSRDGHFFYALDADARRVFGWRVGSGGTLSPLGSADGLPATAAGLAAL